MKWPRSDTDGLPQNTYKPNSSTTTTTEFILMPCYTEQNGEKVTFISIDFIVESDEIQKLAAEEMTELKLVVRVKAYDPMKLYCLHSSRKIWNFPKGECQVKLINTLAPQKKVEESAEHLEIRADLRVECYRSAENESISKANDTKA